MSGGFTFAAPDGAPALDPDEVWFQFLCTTGPGEHEAGGTPDAKVRPEHACMHGTYWRLDDPAAPIPPVDWGCRCAMSYCAAPDSKAAKLLPPAKDAPEVNAKAVSKEWLNDHSPGWEKVAKKVAQAQPQDAERIAKATAKAVGVPVRNVPVILQAQPPAAMLPLGTGPLSGVGNAGRRLVEAWRRGDMEAAAKLKRSYPATYKRILIEEGLPHAP